MRVIISYFSILYQAVTKEINIQLTEQILQLLVEIWKIVVYHFRGAAALMIDSAMKGSTRDEEINPSDIVLSLIFLYV
jgi:hypothetical protein